MAEAAACASEALKLRAGFQGAQYCCARVWRKSVASTKRPGPPVTSDEAAEEANEVAKAYIESAEQEGLIEGEERDLFPMIDRILRAERSAA